ncbi:MAG: magnesium/cobalt transporter CorA [Candidatus Micrarchaeia archaeon]
MIRSFLCRGGKVHEVKPEEAALFVREKKNNVWISFEDATKAEEEVFKSLGFHPLSVEDALQGRQRPKIDGYDEYAFIALRTLEKNKEGRKGQLSIFLGDTFIVTYAANKVPSIERVIRHLKENPETLLKGHDFLAYHIIDAVVDGYFPIMDEIENAIEGIEGDVFTKPPSPEMLNKLFKVRRRLVEIRRIVWPMRDILNVLSRRDYPFVTSESAVYYRDVYDHLLRLADITENLRELSSNAMEGYLSTVNNSLNLVVKRLTAITVILMVPTLIASAYGMNVVNLPLAQRETGFVELLGVMGVLTFGSYWYFKKRGWV